MRRKANPLIWAVVALAVFVTALWQQRGAPSPAPAAPSSRTTPAKTVPSNPATSAPGVTAEAPPTRASAPDALSALPAAERAQLEKTLDIIARGGPFPYPKDGTVFSNREGLLPAQRRGYYREYTVPTPGEGTRGARRVIRGTAGETWYTRDHYRSFVRIDA
ncbi:MAG: ribonuclease domain-containing protein [Acidobacteriota bacterium]